MFNTQTVARLVFLAFIVFFAVYFIFVNKSHVEKFEEPEYLSRTDREEVAQVIKDIYLETVKRSPSEQETDFYFMYVSQRNITRQQLTDVISSSADVVSQSLKNNTSSYNTEIYGTEDEVIEVYNDILQRNPNPKELAYYAKALAKDSEFNLEKLKTVLYGSLEHKRLEDLQTNDVHSDLMEGVTDRQLQLMVTNYYKEVVGDSNIDEDTMKFLKKKLVQFKLDEARFKQFLLAFVSGATLTDQIVMQEQIVAQATALQQKEDAFKSQKNKESEELDRQARIIAEKKQRLREVLKDLNSSVDAIEQQCYNIDGKEYCMLQQPNKQVIESLLNSTKAESDNYLDSSSVLDTIKQQASCVFDANSSGYTDRNGSQTMAGVIDDRNTQLLKETCFRNKKFLGIDEDLVLRDDQAWSVPQRRPPVCQGAFDNYQPSLDQTSLIGTLLKDANNTKVGSVLPMHPPR